MTKYTHTHIHTQLCVLLLLVDYYNALERGHFRLILERGGVLVAFLCLKPS